MSRTMKIISATIISATTATAAADDGSVIRLAQNGRGPGVEVSSAGGASRTFVVRSAADFARAEALISPSRQAAITYTCRPASSAFCATTFRTMCDERGAGSIGGPGSATTCGASASGMRPQPVASTDAGPLR